MTRTEFNSTQWGPGMRAMVYGGAEVFVITAVDFQHDTIQLRRSMAISDVADFRSWFTVSYEAVTLIREVTK